MLTHFLLAHLLVFLSSSLLAAESIKPSATWIEFKAHYDKRYDTLEEDYLHEQAFEENKIYIQQHNSLFTNGKVAFELGLNRLSDLPSNEYQSFTGGRRKRRFPNIKESRAEFTIQESLPDSVDWRERGAVTSVKDQGDCASCWAFATVGALEAQHAIKTGTLVDLSVQNLVDCTLYGGNCWTGTIDFAMSYIIKNGGIDKEAAYPYEATKKQCRFRRDSVGATQTSQTNYGGGASSEEKLREVIATRGPVTAAIDASLKSFQLYKSGVYNDPKCQKYFLDHNVLIVGYGTDPVGGDYWLVKNSWGKSWGEKGYVRMARNRNNTCGIAAINILPII